MPTADNSTEITRSTYAPNIEWLASNFPKKEEKTRPVNKKQMHLAQFYFQTIGRLLPKRSAWRAYQIFSAPRRRARHHQSDAILESAKISELRYKHNTLKLYEWGEGSRTVLLAHGWESRGTALRMYVPPLLAHGFRVVAFDAPAHGDSDGTWNNLPHNAGAVTAIIQHFGGIEAAIAHSFGCSSIIFAQQFIDSNIDIRRLVFLAAPNPVRTIVNEYFDMIKLPNAIRVQFEKLIKKFADVNIDDLDIAKAANKVKVEKLLLIHDKNDPITSFEAARRIANTWDNAILLGTEGYGHFRIAKNPDVIARIVSFITS